MVKITTLQNYEHKTCHELFKFRKMSPSHVIQLQQHINDVSHHVAFTHCFPHLFFQRTWLTVREAQPHKDRPRMISG
jgi:hypothetical protein